MIHISSLEGRIGEFWWINAQPGNPVLLSGWLPGPKRQLVFWGGCGLGREAHVKMGLLPAGEGEQEA